MPKNLRISAYRQGRLDGLCGVYATINAVRLTCSTPNQRFSIFGKRLFEACLNHLALNWPLADVVANGMTNEQLLACLKLVKSHLKIKRKINIRLTRPLIGSSHKTLADVIDVMAVFLSQHGRSIILGYSTLDGGHWTVVRSVGVTAFNLVDSSGASRLTFAQLTYRNWRKAKAEGKRDLTPTGIIFLEWVNGVG